MSFSVRAAAAAAKTNQDGRALLGVTADYLRQAYDVLPELTNLAGVQDSARDWLDRANAYAQGVYALIPDDAEPLREDLRPRILTSLLTAESALRTVREARADLEIDYLAALADVVPAGISAVAGAAAGAALDHWVLVLALALGLVVFLRLRAGMVPA